MKIKASLHLHTHEDIEDRAIVKYSIYELIDRAAELDFKVLALTGHKTFLYRPEYGEYASQKGILLIPGIEAEVDKRHVLILNVGQEAEKIRDFDDLKKYRQEHPECLVIAPHPAFKFLISLGMERLRNHHELFDAIEKSWFYSRWLNFNKPAEKFATNYKKPFVATADLHNIKHLDYSYIIVELEELTIPAIFEAIRRGRFENVSSAKPLWELVANLFGLVFADRDRFFQKLFKKIKKGG